MVPHLGHTELIVAAVVTAGVSMRTLVKYNKEKMLETPLTSLSGNVSTTHVLSLELTFAGLDALKPCVLFRAAGSSTCAEPRAPLSATTSLTFAVGDEHPALRTHFSGETKRTI